ncbi:Sgf11 (transcriptional regulation protein) protein [Tripterygium wilfordii]|uniref:SAGA-associated factor 11 n=2 Tax=Tripterygium wilfordii TaxID=458696 RepID=A0A7J7DZ33_TRIWF|nr:SAGA-associated factor 11-like isoform X2 [Tripterygium wilfordii]XP_038724377.1 SAGA-associated factor 11-like isoform X2 [Tripterygium wilfordii]XP_038724386.1 SAGA-associated factor 11-like isoform X2 [Tripterygium wilfordii]KAF5751346.1 Sgf11 (transcriptional regulation protein) protein [Tripterygium wilfordii]
MSAPNEDNLSSHSQLSSQFFENFLDSMIADVASECHRMAKLGLDRNLEEGEDELRSSVLARAQVADPSNSGKTNNGKDVHDIFGNDNSAAGNEIFKCMKCGKPTAVGKFAPHLENCMGKGRKSRPKTRSSTALQNQNRYSKGEECPDGTTEDS